MIKMSDYKLSVVVPTFNTGEFLNDLVDSLINQSIGFENIELIFVDDASTDSLTLNLINDFVFKYPNNCKAIFLEDNSGFPGGGRNIGIKESSADFVIVADHDDSYEKEALKVLYNEITKNNADIVITNFNQVFKEKIIPFKSSITKNIEVTDISKNKDILKIPAAIWTRLFRKDFLTQNNIEFLEEMLGEDVYFAAKSSLKASKIIYLPEFYGYNYNIRDSADDKSTIHIRNKKYLMAMLEGYYEISKMLAKENEEEYSKCIFNPHLTSWLYTIVISDISDNDIKELLKRAINIFKNNYTNDPYFKGRYENLVKFIKNNELDLAIKEINKLKQDEKNINDSLKENKYKKLFKRVLKKN